MLIFSIIIDGFLEWCPRWKINNTYQFYGYDSPAKYHSDVTHWFTNTHFEALRSVSWSVPSWASGWFWKIPANYSCPLNMLPHPEPCFLFGFFLNRILYQPEKFNLCATVLHLFLQFGCIPMGHLWRRNCLHVCTKRQSAFSSIISVCRITGGCRVRELRHISLWGTR